MSSCKPGMTWNHIQSCHTLHIGIMNSWLAIGGLHQRRLSLRMWWILSLAMVCSASFYIGQKALFHCVHCPFISQIVCLHATKPFQHGPGLWDVGTQAPLRLFLLGRHWRKCLCPSIDLLVAWHQFWFGHINLTCSSFTFHMRFVDCEVFKSRFLP